MTKSAWLAGAGPIAGLLVAGAAPAPEALSSYDIRLRAEPNVVHVTGQAVFPVLATATNELSFLLTPLASETRFSWRCGARPMPVRAQSSAVEEGDRRWRLRSDRPCPAGATVRLSFTYKLSGAAPQLRIGADRGFAGGGGETWYPQLSFAERQRGTVTLDLPAGLAGIATGTSRGAARRGGRDILRFDTRGPVKLAFVYGPYAAAHGSGRPAIRVLTLGHDSPASELLRRIAPQIAVLEQAFGPAPFADLALVETDFQSRVLGTSEYGMIFADPSQIRGPFNAAYWAHEFGHQWWGVTLRPVPGSPGAMMLTEGVAEYGAQLAIEATQGVEAAAAYRLGSDAEGRRRGLGAYRHMLAGGRDRAVAEFQPSSQDEIVDAHRLANFKGATLLSYLGALAGRDRINRALAQFFATSRNERVQWSDLERALDAATGGEFRWFLDQWFHRAGPPAVEVDYCVSGASVEGIVRQSGAEFRLPMPVEISGRWGRRRALIEANGSESRFRLNAPGAVEAMTVDPDVLVPTVSTVVRRRCG